MQDLALNSDLSVFLNSRNDVAKVEGQEAFEQAVAVRLTDFMYNELTGISAGDDTTKEKIRLEVSRVARSTDIVDQIAGIEVEQDEESPDTYNVTIQYVAGDSWEFEL